MNRSQSHRWMHCLQPILEAALDKKMALPRRKISSMEEFIKTFPGVKRLILDGTERPIQRSSDQDKQKQNYSWQKETSYP